MKAQLLEFIRTSRWRKSRLAAVLDDYLDIFPEVAPVQYAEAVKGHNGLWYVHINRQPVGLPFLTEKECKVTANWLHANKASFYQVLP